MKMLKFTDNILKYLLLPICILAFVLKWHLYLCEIKTALNCRMTAKMKMYGLEELTAIIGLKNMVLTKSCVYQLSLIFWNNLNIVLWWSKYWFRSIQESLTGFYAEQTPSICVEWRIVILSSSCYLRFFIIPWFIEWCKNGIFDWQKIDIFPFLREAYSWAMHSCYFPSILQRSLPLSHRHAMKTSTRSP